MKNHGYSLIELIIIILITSILVGLGSKLLVAGLNGYITAKDTTDAVWQGRIALERIARDLRKIQSPSGITTAAVNQLIFNDTDNTTITYALSGTSLTRNSQILASGIGSLSFTYFDETGTSTAVLSAIRYITITLNVTQGNTNFNVITSIYPRNLP